MLNMVDAQKVRVLESNTTYRLADLIFRKGIRWQIDRNTILADKAYDETILKDYLKGMRQEEDWKHLKAVVLSHSRRYQVPHSDELVIHLRLGDIMGESTEFASRGFERAFKVYGDFDIDLPKDIKSVSIVTALHFGANELNNKYFYSALAHERSLRVVRALKSNLESKGYSPKLVSSENVDSDFCYLASSNYFVRSYSRLSDFICSGTR